MTIKAASFVLARRVSEGFLDVLFCAGRGRSLEVAEPWSVAVPRPEITVERRIPRSRVGRV